MIELSRHIESLLLDNDCVIVPDLGGFIAHYQPARYEEDEGVFMPPYRSVGFNPQLMMNDGLLVQSYMQAHHTDYPDAVREIAQGVDTLKNKLFRLMQTFKRLLITTKTCRFWKRNAILQHIFAIY